MAYVAPPFRICFVCTGNICRSPTAEVVARHLLAGTALDGRVRVGSAGLGDWHVGDGADRRTVAALHQRGYPTWPHRARQFRAADFAEHDLVLALDRGHRAALTRLAPGPADAAKIRLLRSYDSAASPDDLDVPDPYYGGRQGFERVLDMIEAACRGLVAELIHHPAAG